jgi:hypothetical protein
MRLTAAETEYVRYLQANGTTRTVEEIVKGYRRTSRNAKAQLARRDAHIAKRGLASAGRWYTGI